MEIKFGKMEIYQLLKQKLSAKCGEVSRERYLVATKISIAITTGNVFKPMHLIHFMPRLLLNILN